jgi:hypothetical protein
MRQGHPVPFETGPAPLTANFQEKPHILHLFLGCATLVSIFLDYSEDLHKIPQLSVIIRNRIYSREEVSSTQGNSDIDLWSYNRRDNANAR